MKRARGLLEQIASLDNLYLAYKKASRGKLRKKEVCQFRNHLDENISLVRKEIVEDNVSVGNYHYFTIHDPKERVICAASFPERILHHAIMNICHDYFDRRLITHTFATRPGKGSYQALDYAMKAATRCKYLAKLDFRKYFDSISHEKLKEIIRKIFKDANLLRLFDRIIDSYNVVEGRGIPIGNLTSQYFANAYLSDMDHWAKEELHLRYYIRYMDDILMGSDDKNELKLKVQEFRDKAFEQLRLNLKPPIINTSNNGVVFLGYRVLPHYYLLSGRSKRRFCSKLSQYERLLEDGVWDQEQYSLHILPLLSFTTHAKSRGFRKSCMETMNG